MIKKIAFLGAVVFLLLVINGLLHSIFDLWQKRDLLTVAQQKLEAEQQKNQKLKADLTYVQSKEFIEEAAHDKLFLVKPGEQKVLIAEDPKEKKEDKAKKEVSNWKRWLNLFF